MQSAEEAFARRKGLNVRDALIFLIDFRQSMTHPDPSISISPDLVAPEATPSLLSITLRTLADILKSKLIARSPDPVSLIAFGTRGPTTRRVWPSVHVLRPLRPPDAAAVKQLQHLAHRLEHGAAHAQPPPQPDHDPLRRVGPDIPVPFDKALWAARHQLTALASSRRDVLHRARVFVFTNDDDPSRGDAAVRALTITHARDLADIGAALDVSLLVSPGALAASDRLAPDPAKFFDEIVYGEEGAAEVRGVVSIAPVTSFEDLVTRVRRKHVAKRAIRKTVLILADDYKIGVALYALVKKAARPAKVELVASTNKPVFKITTATCERSGEILKPAAVRTTFTPDFLKNTRYKVPGTAKGKGAPEASDAGNEPPSKVVFGFKSSELPQAKAIGKAGIIMYGFRKMTVLRREYTLASPTFLYPDETEYVGSTKAFACLLQCMLNRGVAGIAGVRLNDKSTTGIRFAALVPQQEDFSDNLEHTIPAGLQMYYLPYKDDIYTAWRNEMAKKEEDKEEQDVVVKEEEMESNELNDEPPGVSVARRMVRNLTVENYSPDLFLNPDLQRFYSGLEHAAGVESQYNPQDDLLDPDIEAMEKNGGHIARELKRLEVGDDYDGDALAEQFGTKGNKRTAEQSETAVRREAEKQKKFEQAKRDCDDRWFEEQFRNGAVGKLLKPDLQVYCRAHGLGDKGTKKNLVIVVEDDIRERLDRQGVR